MYLRYIESRDYTLSTFAEICFEKLKEADPDILCGALVKSKIRMKDIQRFESIIGYSLPTDFQEFLMSYVFPKDTFLIGEFLMWDWVGGWMTFSKEEGRYIYDVPEEQESTLLRFCFEKLWELSSEPGDSFIKKMMESEICEGLLKAGYIELGTFSNNYVLLNIKNSNIVYINHEFYPAEIISFDDFKEMEDNFEVLFKNFHILLQCLFLGNICDPGTGEIREYI